MANPVVGYVPCPHCGGQASVHREARGLRAMYYRCYEQDGMSMRCGTVQIRGPSGQVWIEKHMSSEAGGGGAPGNDEKWERRKELRREDLSEEVVSAAVSAVVTKRRRGLLDLIPSGGSDE